MVEVQWLQLLEAGGDTGWATTEMYSLKGVLLLVPLVLPPILRPPPMAVTGTAATKDTGEGQSCGFYGGPCLCFGEIAKQTTHVFVLPVILTHSRIAASRVTSDLSCQDEIRKGVEDVVVTGIEDVGVEKEDAEEEKPTEEDGIVVFILKHLKSLMKILPG